jgi:hypothetical protein
LQELKLKVRGLFSHGSELAAMPEGALLVADDIVIDREDIAEPRRGFGRSSAGFSDAAYRATKLFMYQDYLFATYSTNLLAYYSTQLASASADFDGSGAWTAVSGTYAPPTGHKTHTAEANQNLYLTSGAGIYKLDAYNSTPVKAGAVKALDLQASLTNVTGNWLAADYRVAYRVVWGYKDANNNLILGAPSQREVITNTAGATRAVSLTLTIPSTVDATWFFQVYRSSAVDNSSGDVEPSDELGLVYEANPSGAEITAKSITFDDITPDALRGATIYTASTQEGLAAGNEQPPMATDIAVYKNVLFYANTTSKHRKYVTLLAAGGTNGLAVNDTITIGGITYTAKNAENVATPEFRVTYSGSFTFVDADVTVANPGVITENGHPLQNGDLVTLSGSGLPGGLSAGNYYIVNRTTNTFQLATTLGGTGVQITSAAGAGTYTVTYGGSSSQNIRDTALSLVRVINQHTSSTVYAYYLSGPDDLPGKLLFEERSIGGASFTVSSSNSSCWTPDISVSDNQDSTNDRYKNAVYYSKTSQPEAVPLGNYFFAGSAQKEILRIVPLRDSLFIFKQDGIYRLSGEDSSSFRVDLLDSTARLLAAETAVVLNNQIYCLTDQGVVSVTEGGVQVRSRPIEATITALNGINPSVLRTESFAVSYETERKYILFVPRLAGDTKPSQAFVFNTFTNTWTRWVLGKTAGVVNPADDKLYLADLASNYINQERKSLTFQDYVDYGFAATISAVSGLTLTMNGTDQISAGDVIYQSSTVYSTVASVDNVAGTVTVSTSAAFATGATDVLKAISTKVGWAPITAGNPGALKQFREATLLFKADFTGSASLVFTSDASSSQETETITGTAVGTWGLFEWGGVPWGGGQNRRPVYTWVPRNKQRCTQLLIEFRHAVGYAHYQLTGISIVANGGSTRVAV